MTVWLKQGVLGILSREMRRGLGRLHACFGTIYITSKVEGDHIAGSLHYDGNAIDCRFAEDEIGATKAEVMDCLGSDFDVVEYSTWMHIEYDPKGVVPMG